MTSLRRILALPVRAIRSAKRRYSVAKKQSVIRRRLALPMEVPTSVPGGYVVFFTPEAGVPPHYSSQCILARTLKERGYPVLVTRCFDVFRRCPVMDMHKAPYAMPKAERESYCLNCAANAFGSLDEYGLPSLDLRTFVDSEWREEIRRALREATADPMAFEFQGIAFGKICALDLVLGNKISDLVNLSETHRAGWFEYIESSVTSYCLIKEMAKRVPIRQLVYFNDYSIMLGARLAAESLGIPTVGISLASHRSVDFRQFVFYSRPSTLTFILQAAQWPAWRDYSLTPARVAEIGEDIFERFLGRASHVYSPPKTSGRSKLRDHLSLDPNKNLLAAFTSSPDEFRAAGVLRSGLSITPRDTAVPFPDQIAWLKALVTHVESREDRQLVVRIHPREGSNKRESTSSQHLVLLKESFDRPLRNCRFVWPEEPISSYDIGELADVALSSWSSIGLELARMGVPVLVSAYGLMETPDEDFLNWGSTPNAYFAKLDEILLRPAALDRIVRAFRWYNLIHLGVSLDLSDVVPESTYSSLPAFRMPREAEAIEDILLRKADVLEINRERLQSSQRPESASEEFEALRVFLRRFLMHLFAGESAADDYPLTWSNEPRPNEHAILNPEGNMMRLTIGENSWLRDSPMARRLGPLAAQTHL